MPKATRMEPKQLSVADRLRRIREIVEALPDGDQDKEDLILLFDELENALLSVHQLQGALNTARWALEVALERINKQDEALAVLSIGND